MGCNGEGCEKKGKSYEEFVEQVRRDERSRELAEMIRQGPRVRERPKNLWEFLSSIVDAVALEVESRREM